MKPSSLAATMTISAWVVLAREPADEKKFITVPTTMQRVPKQVVELARMFAKRGKAPGRRLVFICFSAEEMGLLGAKHYVKEPLFPLEDTVAMVNFDMIGWLRDDKLTVFNWNSCAEFAPILENANQAMKLDLVKPVSGFAGSDHLPFLQYKMPVMFMHTGLTSTYHTPEDDFETLDCDGALKVIPVHRRRH